jgi:hypothetical protein
VEALVRILVVIYVGPVTALGERKMEKCDMIYVRSVISRSDSVESRDIENLVNILGIYKNYGYQLSEQAKTILLLLSAGV